MDALFVETIPVWHHVPAIFIAKTNVTDVGQTTVLFTVHVMYLLHAISKTFLHMSAMPVLLSEPVSLSIRFIKPKVLKKLMRKSSVSLEKESI